MGLIEFEKEYSKEIAFSFDSLKNLYEKMIKLKTIDLNKKEISKAILIRLNSWYSLQNNIKKFLNKRYVAAGSDFFVETVIFYLKVVFEIFGVKREVHSERQIVRRRGAIRPDISIWDKDVVKAIIECKTQLGWNRYKWRDDFIKKEKKLKSEFPNARAFLVVMTSRNWPGFGKDKNVGKKFFTLYNVWPTEIDPNGDLNEYIENPIEPLIKSLIED
jgi:hypothetical protein